MMGCAQAEDEKCYIPTILTEFFVQVIDERWTVGMYNTFFTSAPPVTLGLFDRTCTDKTREK